MKYKLDHGESLALARKYSNFECSYDQAYSVYSKLRMLKKKFSCQSGALKVDNILNTPENQLSAAGSDLADSLASVEDSVSLASSRRVLEGTEIKKSPNSGKNYENVNSVNEEMSERGTTGKLSLHLSSFKMKTDSIEKIFLRREENLLLKQQLEFTELVGRMEEERTRLKEIYDLQLNSIYSQHVDFAIRNGKINLLNEEFFNSMSKFDQYVKCQHKKLATMQVDARRKDRQIKHHWLREVKAGRSAESFDRLPLSESGFCLEEFKVNEITASLGWTDGTSIPNSVSDPALPSDCQGIDLISGCLAVSFKSGEQSAEPPAFSPNRGETHLESSSTESLTNASQVETCTVLVVTENPVPQQCTVSPISVAPDKLLIDSVIVASVDDKLHGSTDNSNGPCSPQNLQVNVPLAEISQSSGETHASVDQVLIIVQVYFIYLKFFFYHI